MSWSRAPVDLTNKRFGNLVVISNAGRKPEGQSLDRHARPFWECVCDCGESEVVDQRRLTGKTRPYRACAACRQPNCNACGAKIPLGYPSKTVCSDVCKTVYKREQYRTDYYRRKVRDPGFLQRQREQLAERAKNDPDVAARLRAYSDAQAAKRRERRRQDPEYAAQMAAQARKQYHRNREQILARRRLRRRFDPTHAERCNEWARQYYRANREEILASRSRRWFQLSPAEQRAEQNRHRERQRKWKNRWRSSIRRDPQAHREQLAKEREWERGRNLRKLFSNLEQLKGNNDDE